MVQPLRNGRLLVVHASAFYERGKWVPRVKQMLRCLPTQDSLLFLLMNDSLPCVVVDGSLQGKISRQIFSCSHQNKRSFAYRSATFLPDRFIVCKRVLVMNIADIKH